MTASLQAESCYPQFLEPEYLELFSLVRRRYELPPGHLAKAGFARGSIETSASPGTVAAETPVSPVSPSADPDALSSTASQFGRQGWATSHEEAARAGTGLKSTAQETARSYSVEAGQEMQMPHGGLPASPGTRSLLAQEWSPPVSANLAGIGSGASTITSHDTRQRLGHDIRPALTKTVSAPLPSSQNSVAKALELLQQAGLVNFDADATTMAAAIALVSSQQEDLASHASRGDECVQGSVRQSGDPPRSPDVRQRSASHSSHLRHHSPPLIPLPQVPESTTLHREYDEATVRSHEWRKRRAIWLQQQAKIDHMALEGPEELLDVRPRPNGRHRSASGSSSRTDMSVASAASHRSFQAISEQDLPQDVHPIPRHSPPGSLVYKPAGTKSPKRALAGAPSHSHRARSVVGEGARHQSDATPGIRLHIDPPADQPAIPSPIYSTPT